MENRKEKFCMDVAFYRFFSRKYPLSVTRRTFFHGHEVAYHNHDFPQVWYCLDGRYDHRVADRIYPCRKGSLVIIPPGVYHDFTVPDDSVADCVFLNVKYDFFLNKPMEMYVNSVANLFLPRFSQELDYEFPEFVTLSGESRATAEKLLSQLSAIDFLEPEDAYAQMYPALERFFSVPELAFPEQARESALQLAQTYVQTMATVLSYINQNFRKKLLSRECWKISNICRTNFFKIFQRYLGCTYSQYLQMLRVRCAWMYITNTTCSLADISDLCGFSDQSAMNNCFRRYLFRSPREEREIRLKYLNDHPDLRLHIQEE